MEISFPSLYLIEEIPDQTELFSLDRGDSFITHIMAES